MHHHLDVYAYTNGLSHVHPQQKLLFGLALLLLTLEVSPPIQGLLWLWLNVWIVGYARIPWGVYYSLVGSMAVFWLFSLPALLVQVAPTAVATAPGQSLVGHLALGNWSFFVTSAGLMTALAAGLRTITAGTCLLFIVLTTPIPMLLGVLERWHLPSFLLDIVMLMYRYIFILLDTAVSLQLAQRARGGYQRRSRWLFSLSLLAAQLLRQSLQRYQATNLALVSRGFSGQFRVWRSRPCAYSRRYAVEAVMGTSLLLLLNFTLA